MTLAELKILLEAVTKNLKTFGNEKNISQAANNLHDNLQKFYANDPDGSEKISVAMKEVNFMVRNYMSAVQKLQLIQSMLQNIVNQADEKGISDATTMNVKLPLNYIQDCNNIVSAYAAALMQVNIAYNKINSNQVVYLSPDDLLATPPPALNNIVSTMSGHPNLSVWNEKLVSASHTKLDKTFICEGFYKDHDNTYFQGQMINPVGRRTDFDPEVTKKINDFVDLYLEKTGLPESWKPNLLGLLSTVAYQSGIGGILYEQGLNNVHLASRGDNPGETMIISGGQYALQFFFEANGTIKIACMSTFYPPPATYILDNGGLLHGGMNFVQSVAFDIACGCSFGESFNTGPVFTVQNFQRNLSSYLDESHLNTLQWMVNQKSLSVHHHVDKKYFSIFGNAVECLIKFAGFKSIDELAEKTKLTSSVLSVFSSGLFSILTIRKALSPEESGFFESLSLAFYRDKKTPQELAKLVTNFFAERFYSTPNEDKTRYIYLLKMAVDFAGFNYAPVKEAFQELLNGLAQNQPALVETLKKDIDFYHLYLEEINKTFSWFSKLPKLSIEEHFAIMQALNTNNDYFHFLAKNPETLKEDLYAISFLQQLSVEQKIIFLNYTERSPSLLSFLKEPFFSLSDQDMAFMTNQTVTLGELLMSSQLEIASDVLRKVHHMMEILEKTPRGDAKPLLGFLQLAEQTYHSNMTARLQQATLAAERKPRAPIPLPENKPAEVAQKPEKTVEKPKKSIPVPEVTEAELEGTSPKELYESFQAVLTQAEKKAKPYVESKQAAEKEAPAEVTKEGEKTKMGTETDSDKKPSGKTQG